MRQFFIFFCIFCAGFTTTAQSVQESMKKANAYYNKGEYIEAVKLYRQLADQGHGVAMCELGICYFTGKGVAKDKAEAMKWFSKAAEQGNAHAQYCLGIMADSMNESVKWYIKAADQGHRAAQYELGYCYFNGIGIDKDIDKGLEWIKKAANQGNKDAKDWLDYSVAVNRFREAAEQADASAQYNLGECYAYGRGVDRNHIEAVKWFRKAAEQGHGAAQYKLGCCYLEGDGVEKDIDKGFEWLEKAANNGNEDAKNYLLFR